MRADRRAYRIDQEPLDSKTFFNLFLHVQGILLAIAVTDENNVIFLTVAAHLFLHIVYQRIQ